MDASATIPHGLKNKKRKAHKITADNHSPAPEPSTASLIESIKKKSKAAFVNDTSTPTPEEHKESKKDKKNGKQIDQDPTPSNGEDESPNDGAEEEEEEVLEAAEEMEELKSFADLGIVDQLCEACETLKYKNPTPIQVKSIPLALSGKDLIGLAETGSGKTAAFALPILQALLEQDPGKIFAVVIAPTRELAFQISEQFDALGGSMNIRTAVIVGGMDTMQQSIALSKNPHVVVATPGRLLDHLENTKGFSLRTLKYLVMDEADRLLDLDFGPIIEKILKVIPSQRRTYLFSATMTDKVERLQRMSLSNPVAVSVSTKYSTVKTLLQYFLLIPQIHKDTYLVYLVAEKFAGKSMIIFSRTVNDTQRVAFLLRLLGCSAIPLHGQLSQTGRLGALNKFKAGTRNILVATDVAARGLDIPSVDYVINYDIAGDSKTYIHRVGRTARAGRSGVCVNLVTQYDVEEFTRIEKALGKKLDKLDVSKEAVAVLADSVGEAQRQAIKEVKDWQEKKNGPGGGRGGRGGRGRGGQMGSGPGRRRDDMDREER